MADQTDRKDKVVSLVFNTNRKTSSTVGVPSDTKVSIELYEEAYTKRRKTISEYEESVRAEHPEFSDEQVERAVHDYILEWQAKLEAIMAAEKLEWVMNWRVFEERLNLSSEAEKTRIKKLDSQYRTPARKEGETKKQARVPLNADQKREAAILTVMKLGLTREAAIERLGMTSHMKALDAEIMKPRVNTDEDEE